MWGDKGGSMKSSIARATAIEYGLIAAGILVSCIVRYFHYGLGASAAEYGIIAVGAAVMLILVVEGFVSRLYRPL
jgi:Flp pilus assembly pilin Flp